MKEPCLISTGRAFSYQLKDFSDFRKNMKAREGFTIDTKINVFTLDLIFKIKHLDNKNTIKLSYY